MTKRTRNINEVEVQMIQLEILQCELYSWQNILLLMVSMPTMNITYALKLYIDCIITSTCEGTGQLLQAYNCLYMRITY